MKNIRARLMQVALVASSLLMLSATAHAAWKVEDLRWRMLGRQAIGFSASNPVINGTDTSFVAAAPARLDTTTSWSMLDCDNVSLTGSMGGTVTGQVLGEDGSVPSIPRLRVRRREPGVWLQARLREVLVG